MKATDPPHGPWWQSWLLLVSSFGVATLAYAAFAYIKDEPELAVVALAMFVALVLLGRAKHLQVVRMLESRIAAHEAKDAEGQVEVRRVLGEAIAWASHFLKHVESVLDGHGARPQGTHFHFGFGHLQDCERYLTLGERMKAAEEFAKSLQRPMRSQTATRVVGQKTPQASPYPHVPDQARIASMRARAEEMAKEIQGMADRLLERLDS